MPCGTSLQLTTTSLHASPLVIYHPHKRVLLKLLATMFPLQQPRSTLIPRHTHVCSRVCQFLIILCVIGHPRMRRYTHISVKNNDLFSRYSEQDTGWTMGEGCSNPRTGNRYFSKTFRPALGLAQRERYFSGLKRPGRGDRHSPLSSA